MKSEIMIHEKETTMRIQKSNIEWNHVSSNQSTVLDYFDSNGELSGVDELDDESSERKSSSSLSLQPCNHTAAKANALIVWIRNIFVLYL